MSPVLVIGVPGGPKGEDTSVGVLVFVTPDSLST